MTRDVIGLDKETGRSMRLHRYWNVWSYAQFQFVPVREPERKASRRNASCEFESFVVSFRGSTVDRGGIIDSLSVLPLSKSDREGGELKSIILYSGFVQGKSLDQSMKERTIDEAKLVGHVR